MLYALSEKQEFSTREKKKKRTSPFAGEVVPPIAATRTTATLAPRDKPGGMIDDPPGFGE